MKGAPDRTITACLIILAILTFVVALYGPPALKLAFLVWMIAP